MFGSTLSIVGESIISNEYDNLARSIVQLMLVLPIILRSGGMATINSVDVKLKIKTKKMLRDFTLIDKNC